MNVPSIQLIDRALELNISILAARVLHIVAFGQ